MSLQGGSSVSVEKADLPVFLLYIGVLVASLSLSLSPIGDHGVVIRGVETPDVCPFHRISGLWCPGCGLTRSFIYMGHGQICDAVHLNPLGPVLFCLLILQILMLTMKLFRVPVPIPIRWQRIIEFGKEALLCALLLLGAWRIAWGLAHPALTHTTAIPPSNREVVGALLLASIALTCAYRILRDWRARAVQRGIAIPSR